MDEYAQSAGEIERGIHELQARHLPFSTAQGCALCGANAMSQQFYLFPCRCVK